MSLKSRNLKSDVHMIGNSKQQPKTFHLSADYHRSAKNGLVKKSLIEKAAHYETRPTKRCSSCCGLWGAVSLQTSMLKCLHQNMLTVSFITGRKSFGLSSFVRRSGLQSVLAAPPHRQQLISLIEASTH